MQPGGVGRPFAYEDVGAFLRFLKDDIAISEQPQVAAVIEKLFSVVDPLHIGAAKRASELSSDIGERLLLTHMKGDEAEHARKIAEDLNKSFFAHGDAVSRTRAKALHLRIADEDPQLERLIWDAYVGLESYMAFRVPFIPLQVYMADPTAAAALRPVAPVNLPSNTPPQLLQQIWNTVFQNATQNLANAAIEVPYSLINAVVESIRLASEFRTEGRFSASRGPNGEIQIMGQDTYSRWGVVVQPQPVAAPAQVTPAP